tara:strand:+ start:667 stop:777 length:111 start_codon:yes stop_codon:yes gene_type:complete
MVFAPENRDIIIANKPGAAPVEITTSGLSFITIFIN